MWWWVLATLSEEKGRQERRVVRQACKCTSRADYRSNGVDVRPRIGCEAFLSGEPPYCYVVSSPCPGSAPSGSYPGAAYLNDCTYASPPPPAPAACSDPYFAQQWHHERARVTDAWGTHRPVLSGVSLVVVDDGVDLAHPDLEVSEYVAWTEEGERVNQSSMSVDVTHGTAVSGVVAAIADNGIGGCGVAPGVTLKTAALLSAPDTQVFDVAEAESLDTLEADVYTNSWGPPDDLGDYQMGPLYAAALERARTQKRGGKGAIVLFAAGNGGPTDNSNADPYTAHRYTLSVGAVGDDGRYTPYSEPGACILVCAPSNGGYRGIVTADAVGEAGYGDTDITGGFGGTSAATPLVAGVVVLLLAARPELTWRDVHAVLARSAHRVDPEDSGWTRNGAGHWVHPYYGFGMVDAGAAVSLAREWTLLEAEVQVTVTHTELELVIPDDGEVASLAFVVEAGVRVETAELELEIHHASRGDLRILLVSPSGTRSVLTTVMASHAFRPFGTRQFSSVAFQEEAATGNWTLLIEDVVPSQAGTLRAATLRLYGTAMIPHSPPPGTPPSNPPAPRWPPRTYPPSPHYPPPEYPPPRLPTSCEDLRTEYYHRGCCPVKNNTQDS